MAFHHDFPFGLDRITLHLEGTNKRVLINPNDPASVVAGLQDIMGRNILKAAFTPTENPKYNEWRAAVAARETMQSFEEWSGS